MNISDSVHDDNDSTMVISHSCSDDEKSVSGILAKLDAHEQSPRYKVTYNDHQGFFGNSRLLVSGNWWVIHAEKYYGNAQRYKYLIVGEPCGLYMHIYTSYPDIP